MKLKRKHISSEGVGDYVEENTKSSSEFYRGRIDQEAEPNATIDRQNRPHGNAEYEQMIAEDVCSNTKRVIAKVAYFIAERRGFVAGQEEADWLQAEIDVKKLLRSEPPDSEESSGVLAGRSLLPKIRRFTRFVPDHDTERWKYRATRDRNRDD